ncbi:ABC transporter permease [Actinophytocola sediminis]
MPSARTEARTEPPPRARPARRRPTVFGRVSIGIAVLFAALALYPLGAVVYRLLFADGSLDLGPVRDTLAEPDLAGLLLNTLVVVVAATAVALVIGTALAWVNERTDARMGVLTDALPMVPFLLPPVAGAIGWVLLLSPKAGYLNTWLRDLLGVVGIDLSDGPFDIYSWYGLILVYTIYQVPYAFLLASAGLRNLDPSLEEQSRVSGAGPFRTLWRVTVPGVKPSLAGAVLLMLWSGFGLFSIPAVIGTGADIDVLSVRIVESLAEYPPRTGVAVGLSLIVVVFVALAWWAQRLVVGRGRHATVGGKGQRVSRIRLGRWRGPVRALMVLYLLVTTVLPLVALLIVSLTGFWTAKINWGALGFDALRRAIVDDSTTQEALLNSLGLGLLGATIGIAVAAVVALYVSRAGRLGRFLDGAIKLPSTLSHIVLAVGFVLALAGPPFELGGTLTILLLAYLALYLPQAAVAADAAVAQVGGELPEASRVAGAGEARTFRRVYLPLMLPGLITGWALLFVRMIGDLTASSILAGTGNPVVGFRILEIYQNGSYATLAALSTVLTAISCVVVLVVMVLSRRSARWSAPVGR